MPPDPSRKPDPSRVFETRLDDAQPTGFRRYINLIAIVVPVLIGLILVIVIARSLHQPASPAASTLTTTSAPSAPAPTEPAATTAPAPTPAVATTPAPTSNPASTAKPIPAAPTPPPAAKPTAKPAAQPTANTSVAVMNLPPEAVEPMKISGKPQPCAIANLTGLHGTVVLDIMIAKTGAVEDVKAVSGPPLLQSCAVTSVKTYRYQPQPVRIHTQLTLVYQTTPAPQSK